MLDCLLLFGMSLLVGVCLFTGHCFVNCCFGVACWWVLWLVLLLGLFVLFVDY